MQRTIDQLSRRKLQEAARDANIDPDQSYDELRDALDIRECKWCGKEYVHDTWGGFCTDGCQVAYINEYHR